GRVASGRHAARRRHDPRAGGTDRGSARLRSRARLPRGGRGAGAGASAAQPRRPPLRGAAHSRPGLVSDPKKLVLIVIDGLTPSVFEDAVDRGSAAALAFLARHGSYRRALSTFPSLTPVCASSIATGAHPDVHRIPHLVWYDRHQRRIVEYGSSLGAVVAAGTRRSIVDTIFNMNGQHLGAEAVTVFEALDDA